LKSAFQRHETLPFHNAVRDIPAYPLQSKHISKSETLMYLFAEDKEEKRVHACRIQHLRREPHRSPWIQWRLRYSVRNAAQTMRMLCCIHPVRHSWRMPASTRGNPVLPLCHDLRARGSSFHSCSRTAQRLHNRGCAFWHVTVLSMFLSGHLHDC